jgi:hypothetical protein
LHEISLASVQILDGTKVVSDEARGISSLTKPSIAILREVRFQYGSSTSALHLPLNTTVSGMRSQLGSLIGQPCTREKFNITLRDGHPLDDSMTIDGIGVADLLLLIVPTASPPGKQRAPPTIPRPKSCDKPPLSHLSNPPIADTREVPFRYGSSDFQVQLSSNTTVSAMRPQLASFIGGPCREDKFEITLPDKTVLDEDMTIDDIGPITSALLILPKHASPRPRQPAARDSSAPSRPPADLSTSSQQGGRCMVNFQTTADGRSFSLDFQATDTVKTARMEVSKYLGRSGTDGLTLLAKGKVLPDAFLLSRVCLACPLIMVRMA